MNVLMDIKMTDVGVAIFSLTLQVNCNQNLVGFVAAKRQLLNLSKSQNLSISIVI